MTTRKGMITGSRAARPGLVLALVVLAGGGLACGTEGRACLDVTASPRLNYYDEQAHVVVLYLYPLENDLSFQQSSVEDLLRGDRIPGVVGSPLPMTIDPGEKREIEESFPAHTKHLGLLADYYRAPGEPEGTRKLVVKAKCGWFSDPSVQLTPRDLLKE